jgi:hypothetical protein
MLCHLRRYEHVAYDVLHNMALSRKNLQPVPMGCNGKYNKPGITLNGPELSFDALDVAMLQVGSDALVEPGKRFQCGPGCEVWLLGIDANMFDKELVAANARRPG